MDYDTIQDIFNGQAVLPSQGADWTTDLPKTIPLSQNADNRLVEYTGANALFNLNTNDNSETRSPDFDDLAALLRVSGFLMLYYHVHWSTMTCRYDFVLACDDMKNFFV